MTEKEYEDIALSQSAIDIIGKMDIELKEMADERDKLRAALKAIDIQHEDGEYLIQVSSNEHGTREQKFEAGYESFKQTIAEWKSMRDKALTCVKNTEDSSLRTVLSAIQVKCEPDNTYIQISSHDREEFANYQINASGNDLDSLIDWQIQQAKALGIWKPEPEDNKEPDTFADIFDSHAEAFHDLCQHIIDTTSDDRQSLQTYEPSTKVWHDIRIGNAMLMMDVGQIELTRVRYTPK